MPGKTATADLDAFGARIDKLAETMKAAKKDPYTRLDPKQDAAAIAGDIAAWCCKKGAINRPRVRQALQSPTTAMLETMYNDAPAPELTAVSAACTILNTKDAELVSSVLLQAHVFAALVAAAGREEGDALGTMARAALAQGMEMDKAKGDTDTRDQLQRLAEQGAGDAVVVVRTLLGSAVAV